MFSTYHEPVVATGRVVPVRYRSLQVEILKCERDLPAQGNSDPPGAGVAVSEGVWISRALDTSLCPLDISATL